MALFAPSDALEAFNKFVRNRPISTLNNGFVRFRNRRPPTLNEEHIEIVRAKLQQASIENEWDHIFYVLEEDIRDNSPDYEEKKTSVDDYRIDYYQDGLRNICLIIETAEGFGVKFYWDHDRSEYEERRDRDLRVSYERPDRKKFSEPFDDEDRASFEPK